MPGSGDMARFSLSENTPVGSPIYQLRGNECFFSSFIFGATLNKFHHRRISMTRNYFVFGMM